MLVAVVAADGSGLHPTLDQEASPELDLDSEPNLDPAGELRLEVVVAVAAGRSDLHQTNETMNQWHSPQRQFEMFAATAASQEVQAQLTVYSELNNKETCFLTTSKQIVWDTIHFKVMSIFIPNLTSHK